MSGEEVVHVLAAETAAPPAAILEEPMDLMMALQVVLRKSLAHNGFISGLHESAKVIEKRTAQLVLLAEDCNQADYIELVKALCNEHNVNLINVPSTKTLGEWCGVSEKFQQCLRNMSFLRLCGLLGYIKLEQ